LQATYLAWIDVADLGIDDAESYFARHGIGLSPGTQFGAPGHVRFNFGCPRATLTAGLERLCSAINAAS
jgi:cystathionine beta-lyase